LWLTGFSGFTSWAIWQRAMRLSRHGKTVNTKENMKVYQAINKVQSELAVTGITKDRLNTQGSGYKFRGIDDVYNAIAPLLSKHGLCILPRVLKRECAERVSQKGGALFYVTVEAEFDFVCAEDGSKHTVKTFGEAMDSGDKATNKAMSAAYKYAAFQAFSIPTESDNDADSHTHYVQPEAFDLIDALEAVEAAQDVKQLELVWKARSALAKAANDRPSYDALQAAVKERKQVIA
jgi:hypothetical protein